MSATILALSGGVGGAKLALGLYAVLPPDTLTVVVNTGDDFDHLGLRISPDLDTVLYTLAGVADEERGWGRAGETWAFMSALAALGGEAWFQLGDLDLAMHVERTRQLSEGRTLSEITAAAAGRLGVRAAIVPMTDGDVRTVVETDEGPLPFQRYFVERRCAPVVRHLRFDGAVASSAAHGFTQAVRDPRLAGIVICPSNPYLSIDPMLAVPGIRHALAHAHVPVVAVSPLIGARAIKGPTAKIMAEMGIDVSTAAIASHYRGLIDGLVIDASDENDADGVDVPVLATQTLMRTLDDRRRLARDVMAFLRTLAEATEPAVAEVRQRLRE